MIGTEPEGPSEDLGPCQCAQRKKKVMNIAYAHLRSKYLKDNACLESQLDELRRSETVREQTQVQVQSLTPLLIHYMTMGRSFNACKTSFSHL